MWRSRCLLLVSLALLTHATGRAWGEDVSCSASKPLTARQKWVRFAVMQGRLTASVAQGQTATLACGGENQGREESFAVHATEQGTSVRYVIRQGRLTTTFHFHGPDDLTVERTTTAHPTGDGSTALSSDEASRASPNGTEFTAHPSDARPPLMLRQQPGRDIQLSLGEPDIGLSYQAPTLWHLMLTELELAEAELVPLLELLRPDWQLERQTRQIETLLVGLRLAQPRPPLDDLLTRLGDNRFHVRRRANEELRAYGPALLPLLDQLNPRQLNPEQSLRIRKLRESLAPIGEDTSHDVAGWLAYDRRLGEPWLAQGTEERQAFARRQQKVLDDSQLR